MKKKVLFLCQGNSCHSQMAEGLLKHFHGNKYDVFSAGVNPAGVDKNAVEVMNEIGIDISGQTSNPISDFLNTKFDIVVKFNDVVNDLDEDAYPSFWSQVEKFDWRVFDPAERLDYQPDLLRALREVRDDIKNKINKHF